MTDPDIVTPFTGVWIEIPRPDKGFVSFTVTPFTGVWIEISSTRAPATSRSSHPSRVCGLKWSGGHRAPGHLRHTLHGCVD
mgnify:CR=1 FL=1